MSAETNDATLMIRLPNELKGELVRQAAINGRRITADINRRLRESLEAEKAQQAMAAHVPYKSAPVAGRHSVGEALPGTELEHAILAVIRAMPPEKQLAFLTLFRSG